MRLSVCSLLPIAVILLALPPSPAQTLEQWRAQGKELKSAGNAAGALEAFTKASELDPKSAALQDEVGFLLAVLGRQPEALARFERAIQLNPSYAPALFHFGVAAWLAKDPDRAIASLQKAVKID